MVKRGTSHTLKNKNAPNTYHTHLHPSTLVQTLNHTPLYNPLLSQPFHHNPFSPLNNLYKHGLYLISCIKILHQRNSTKAFLSDAWSSPACEAPWESAKVGLRCRTHATPPSDKNAQSLKKRPDSWWRAQRSAVLPNQSSSLRRV